MHDHPFNTGEKIFLYVNYMDQITGISIARGGEHVNVSLRCRRKTPEGCGSAAHRLIPSENANVDAGPGWEMIATCHTFSNRCPAFLQFHST